MKSNSGLTLEHFELTIKEASSVGIEPTTSRLTVERANRLRHEDMLAGVKYSYKISLSIWGVICGAIDQMSAMTHTTRAPRQENLPRKNLHQF